MRSSGKALEGVATLTPYTTPTIYVTDTDKNGNVVPTSQLISQSTIDEKTKYNKDNLNVEYHDDLQKINSNDTYNTNMGNAQVYDVNGNLVDIVSNAVQGNIVYYQPGSYKYGASSYVPYYEDSVFLSRATNSIINAPTNIKTNVDRGFCNKYKTDSIKLEEQCNTINDDTCAATKCCVLLGGQKCVAGGESGPIMKDNYSDFKILNKDFYYYQGKCYGNCPNTPQFPSPTLPEKLPYMPTEPGSVPPIPAGTPMPPLITSIPPPPQGTFV
jgi:hypothetical protein